MATGTVTAQIFASHLVKGPKDPKPGDEVAVRIDQTLTQDATGTLVMLELEALGLETPHVDVAAQYIDHNLLQEDFKNADDHLFLLSAARRFGLRLARAGTGVSHPVHMAKLAVPGRTLLGADSHTCASGALSMVAIGAGGVEVAMAIAGEPFYVEYPAVWGVWLEGQLPAWVSAKDVILELLRRHGTAGGRGRVLEYRGPGLASLSAMDRHVIANLGAELGATTSVFPSDDVTLAFLRQQQREQDFVPLEAEPNASYDMEEVIDLGALEPLIAAPSSPGNVTTVREVAGRPVHQAYLGSSANPGFRDFAVVARMMEGRLAAPEVSFDVAPTSRELLLNLTASSHLRRLYEAGARVHQAGCNGCIGMGQAPASGKNSVRTVPRNFPGRSGTLDDRVWLASPETVAACALTGEITDPRDLADQLGLAPFAAQALAGPEPWILDEQPYLVPPTKAARKGTSLPIDGRPPLEKGPNITRLPELTPLEDQLELEVLLTLGDDISTDEILPAGARVLPFRSNIERIAEFCFASVDEHYVERARAVPGGHAIVAGKNYGQGSSREHAALAPRTLGLRVVLAESFARIHRQNLIAFGVVPLVVTADVRRTLGHSPRIALRGLRRALEARTDVTVELDGGPTVTARPGLSARQVALVLEGGVIRWLRARHQPSNRRSRSAFPITDTDEKLMAAAASIGDNRIPKNG